MARLIPQAQLHPPTFGELPSHARYQFVVLTARYGGGVLPGLPDDTTPFRIPEIRGALRFWWRAVRGADAENSDELRRRERDVWGSSNLASPTSIRVEESNRGQVVEALKSSRTPNGRTRYEPREPAYALFPAQQRDKPGRVSDKGSFTLGILHQANAVPFEVEASLWAWTNFGGYGARTRRGAGALYSPQLSFPARQRAEWSTVRDWLIEQGSKYLTRTPGAALPAQGGGRPWPTLAGAEVLLGQQALPPESAWLACIKVYRDFRQSRNPGTGTRPGRTRWPEPDEIRRQRRRHHSLHAPAHAERYFPRAIFGLPIVFHFKDAGDPEDQSLEPKELKESDEGGRMASPIILKPLIVSPTVAFPMIVRLSSDVFVKGSDSSARITNLMLKQNKPERSSLPVTLGPRRADEEFLLQVEKTSWKTKRFVL